jgi:hypothetical protein
VLPISAAEVSGVSNKEPEEELMTARQPYCKNCGHPSHRNDCGVDDCGCVKYVPRPPRDLEKLRTWVVTATFLVKNRWIEKEVKVKAGGLVGALTKGVREAKLQAVKPGARILQTKATLVPVRTTRR